MMTNEAKYALLDAIEEEAWGFVEEIQMFRTTAHTMVSELQGEALERIVLCQRARAGLPKLMINPPIIPPGREA